LGPLTERALALAGGLAFQGGADWRLACASVELARFLLALSFFSSFSFFSFFLARLASFSRCY